MMGLYRAYIRIMEKKMATTIWVFGVAKACFPKKKVSMLVLWSPQFRVEGLRFRVY